MRLFMKKSFIVYMTVLVMIALGFFLSAMVEISWPLTSSQWIALLVGFVAILISELLEKVYKASLQITFSGAMLLFMVINVPLLIVYIAIIIYVTIIKAFNTHVKHEYKRIIDERLIFNMSQYIIMGGVVASLYSIMPFPLVVKLLLASLTYYVVNIVLLTGVQSAYIGKMMLMPLTLRDYLNFQYYFVITLIGLVLFYEAYGIIGFIFFLSLILPLQKTILEKNSHREMQERLMYDTLTGAYSRAYLEEYFEDQLAEKSIDVFFIDFDHFKEVNDKHGHVVGDEVLKDFVSKMKKMLQDRGKIYRYGGDEFCIIVTQNDAIDALKEQLLNCEKMVYSGEELTIHYGFSAGYYLAKINRQTSFNSIMEEVDRRMYDRKESKNANT